jgi:peptidoglycan/LPS O-acetylase OafA/YrhL/peroxiredoxin
VSTAPAALPAPGKRTPRYTELDALRGAAAVGIVALHAYQNSRTIEGYAYADNSVVRNLIINLDFGLGVFFALSGFVVFLPFAKALVEGRPHMGVKEFTTRRVFRIIPLYFVAILVVWNSRYYGGDGQIADLVRHLTFTQIYHNDKIFYTIGPSWSLAVEVHYYIFTGILVWILTKFVPRVRSRGRRILLVAALPATLAAASLFYKYWAFYVAHLGLDNFPPPHHYTVYYSALARADGFAYGMLLAVLIPVIGNWRPRGPGVARGLVAIALIPFAYMVAVRGDRATDPHVVSLFYYSWIGLATVLVIAATVLSRPEWPWMRLMRSTPVQFTGIVSYSLYMWHEPLMISLEKHHVLNFTNTTTWPLSTLALIAIALVVAWASYHLIEMPGQRLRRLLQIHRPRAPHRVWRTGEMAVRRGTEIATLPALRDEHGAVVALGSIARGRPLVAFLQPGDHTGTVRPGCVTEARAFRDSAYIFDGLGIQVVGISAQPPAAQKAFAARERLPFPMLSDDGGVFTAAAGVPLWRDESSAVYPERVALIVDADGAIQDVLAAEIAPIARPGVAAARSEAPAGAGFTRTAAVAAAPVTPSVGDAAAALGRALRDRLAAPGRPS